MEPLIWEEYFNQRAQEASSQRSATQGRRIRRRAAKNSSSKLARKHKKKTPTVRP